MPDSRLHQLSALGQSVWIDFLSRTLIHSGDLARKMKESGAGLEAQTVYIGHGDAKDDAEFLAETIRKAVPVQGIHIGMISPIIGAHSGPGTVALFFVGSHR
jgi:fatty acid-binding protein DegV